MEVVIRLSFAQIALVTDRVGLQVPVPVCVCVCVFVASPSPVRSVSCFFFFASPSPSAPSKHVTFLGTLGTFFFFGRIRQDMKP